MAISDKLTQIANNVPLVYNAGLEAGKAEGGDTTEAYNQGFTDGKQAEYEAFWKAYQRYAEADQEALRYDWRFAFAGLGWGNGAYNPMFPIVIKGSCEGMYNLAPLTKKVTVNTTECTSARIMFYYCKTTAIGELDLQKCTNTQNLCSYTTNLVSIDKIISSATSVWSASTFEKCTALTHVIFEGTIATNGLNLKDSPLLDKASIESIINCLSSTTSGLTVTLPLIAVNREFEGGSTGTEWKNFIKDKVQDENNSKTHYWIISLA